MKFAHVFEQVFCRPWMITPQAHAGIVRLVESRLPDVFEQMQAGGGRMQAIDDDRPEQWFADFVVPRAAPFVDSDGIGHLHFAGVVGKNLSNIERACGAIGVEHFAAEAEAIFASARRGVLMRVDSPGGGVTGVPELAEQLVDLSINTGNPLVVVTEDLMASAAYYVAAGADMIFAAPSADVGSIGVYMPWVDYANQLAALGLQPDPIKSDAAIYKAAGFTGRLTEQQRALFKEQVVQLEKQFKTWVRLHRPDVDEDAMRGQTLFGQDALRAGLVDALGGEASARQWLLDYMD